MLTTEWGPVGTRGGCGAGWGPGACPGGNAIHWGLRGANRSHPNQDKHQAPSSTPPRPLSLQDPGPQHLNGYDHPIRSSKFIWKGVYAPLNRNCLTSAPIPARELISPHVQGISSVVGVKVE